MNKIFRTNGFVMDNLGMIPVQVTIELDVDAETLEYRSTGYTITANLDKVKDLLSKVNVIGGTYLEEDKDNQVLIRYTKGFHGVTDKGVTMSLSHIDEKGNDKYMITADACELDRYLRKMWND